MVNTFPTPASPEEESAASRLAALIEDLKPVFGFYLPNIEVVDVEPDPVAPGIFQIKITISSATHDFTIDRPAITQFVDQLAAAIRAKRSSVLWQPELEIYKVNLKGAL